MFQHPCFLYFQISKSALRSTVATDSPEERPDSPTPPEMPVGGRDMSERVSTGRAVSPTPVPPVYPTPPSLLDIKAAQQRNLQFQPSVRSPLEQRPQMGQRSHVKLRSPDINMEKSPTHSNIMRNNRDQNQNSDTSSTVTRQVCLFFYVIMLHPIFVSQNQVSKLIHIDIMKFTFFFDWN